MIAAAFVLAAALAWRIRGGWLGLPSTTLGRSVPALVLGGTAWSLSTSIWAAGATAIGIFVGALLPWSRWQDVGHVADDDDLVGMMGRGLLLTWPTGLALWRLGYSPIFMAGGILMGLLYWLAWKIPDGFKVGSFIDGQTAVAELATGAMLAGLLIATLT